MNVALRSGFVQLFEKGALKEGKKKEKEMMQDIVALEETIGELDGEIDNAEDDLAVLTEELEQAQKKLRRTAINNFRLTCKVGVEAGVLPENAVKEALEGMEE